MIEKYLIKIKNYRFVLLFEEVFCHPFSQEIFKPEELCKCRIPPKTLKEWNYDAKDLLYAGPKESEPEAEPEALYSPKELYAAGFCASELHKAIRKYQPDTEKYAPEKFKNYKDLKKTGYTMKELKEAEFEIKDLERADYSFRERSIFDDMSKFDDDKPSYHTWPPIYQQNKVPTLKKMRAFGYEVDQLLSCFLEDNGYEVLVENLKVLEENGPEVEKLIKEKRILKNNNFKIQDLQQAGFSLDEIKSALTNRFQKPLDINVSGTEREEALEREKKKRDQTYSKENGIN